MTTTNQALDFRDVGDFLADVVSWVDHVPTLFWQIALVVTVLIFAPLLWRGRRAARRLGEHRADSISAGQSGDNNNDNTGDNKKIRQEKQLLWASLTFAGSFWLAVLIGSGRGLAEFGRDTLGWRNGWDWLVPATLDGVAVAFAFLAFRALVKQRNPDRARRIVWAATGASAFINFVHELTKDNGAALGAVYLGVLSVLGMAMLDEFLRQFEEGAGYIKREKPLFGLRWITLPYPTLCAWLAWTNYPPEVPEGTRITILMAVEHLERIRSEKIAKRNARDAARSTLPAWTHVAPWVRARKLQAMLDRSNRSMQQQRSTLAEEHRRSMERAEAEHRRSMERAAKERSAEQLERSEREQLLQEQIHEMEQRMERLAGERSAEAEQAKLLAHQLSGATAQSGDVQRALARYQEEVRAAEKARSDLAVKVEQLSGELRSTRANTEREAEQRRRVEQELRDLEQRSGQLLQEMEQRSTEALHGAAEQLREAERIAAERAEQVEALQAALAEQPEQAGNVRSIRTAGAPNARSRGTRSGGAKSDEENRFDLALCFEKNGNDPHDKKTWSQRAVNRACNAGFTGRAQMLIDMAKEHVGQCEAAKHDLDCIIPSGDLADATA
jgi:hypothetical protein